LALLKPLYGTAAGFELAYNIMINNNIKKTESKKPR
jgi:hypothetical protein